MSELLSKNIDLSRLRISSVCISQSYYQTIVNTFLRVSMGTWTDRKFSNRKFPSKSEKSQHTHMKQIIFSSTILDFTWLVIDGFIEQKWLGSFHPKFKIRSPFLQKVPKKFEIFLTRSYKIRKRNLAVTKKYLWVGGVYTIENKDTDTVYQ